MTIRDRDFLERVLPECLNIAETVIFMAACGTIGSGKSSFANAIVEIHPYFRVESFARPLKLEYSQETGVPLEHLSDPVYKEQHRQNMQEHSHRYLMKDRYHYIRKLLLSCTPGEMVVIDDERTIEEAHTVWACGGIMYQIYTNPHVKAARGVKPSKDALNHFTEHDMAVVTAETMRCLGGGRIYNKGSLQDLKDEAMGVLKYHNLLTRTAARV